METAAVADISVAPMEIPSQFAIDDATDAPPPPSPLPSPPTQAADLGPALAILTISPRLTAYEAEEWIKASQRAAADQIWVVDLKSRLARVDREDGAIRYLRLDPGQDPQQEADDDREEKLSEVRRQVASLLPACAETAPAEGPYTADDLASHPQEDQFELINGVLAEKRVMGARAERVKSLLHGAMHVYGQQHPGLGETYCEMSHQLPPKPDKTVRVPDVSFLRQERVPTEWPEKGALPLAPDLAAEIVSPHDLAEEVEEKISLYLQAGVSLIWIIYPRTRSALMIRGDGSGQRLTDGQELDGGDLLPGFRCSLASLFL